MITAVCSHHMVLPLTRRFVTARRRTETIETVIVEIIDDSSRVGWGEAVASEVTGHSTESIIMAIDAISDRLIGQELDSAIEALPSSCTGVVRSAMDCAIYDAMAQVKGISLAQYLGATTHHVLTDIAVSVGDPVVVASQAESHVRDGFTHIKVKVNTGHDPVAVVGAIREAVGNEVSIRVDANQAWTVPEAIAFTRTCEDAGHALEFVEQPVVARDLEGMATIRAACGTPIMADESAQTPADIVTIADRGAADMINIKLAKSGGISGALASIEVARSQSLGILIGCMMEGPVSVGAAACLASLVAPEEVHDLDAPMWLSRESGRVSRVPFGPRFLGPVIDLDEGPGLGFQGLDLP